MTTWHEYVRSTGTVPEYHYTADYGKTSEVINNVLIIGGCAGLTNH